MGTDNKDMNGAISKGSLVRSLCGMRFQWKITVRMTLRLFILGAFLVGMMTLGQKHFADYGSGMLDLVCLLLYLCAYSVSLYFEIRSRLLNSTRQRDLRWVGFHFTFWAVLLWAVIMSVILHDYTPDKYFRHPLYNIYFFMSLSIIYALLSGVIGMVITHVMVLFVFKQPEEV